MKIFNVERTKRLYFLWKNKTFWTFTVTISYVLVYEAFLTLLTFSKYFKTESKLGFIIFLLLMSFKFTLSKIKHYYFNPRTYIFSYLVRLPKFEFNSNFKRMPSSYPIGTVLRVVLTAAFTTTGEKVSKFVNN